MDGSGRDEVVVMLFGGEFVDVLFCVKDDVSALCCPQIFYHLYFVDAFFQTEIYDGIWCCVEQIVAFVLCIGQAKFALGELVGGMYLQTEVASLHGVEEVEADGE